jgi:hypothetical protein
MTVCYNLAASGRDESRPYDFYISYNSYTPFPMPQLDEVYSRLVKNKKRRSELNKMFKDEMSQDQRYGEVVEEMTRLREEKKGIENEIKAGAVNESNELDELKLDIATDQELLADIALNMYVKSETVEIIDEFDQKWTPQFKVSFKKE